MTHIFDNALLFNPCTGEWLPTSFAVENGVVAAIGANHSLTGDRLTDLGGARVIPGLIDTHLHIESTFLVPHEFGRVALSHGVTTAIADPHEIANVAGLAGIDFMIQDAQHAPNDIFFMVPSCVPATPDDVGGAVLTAADLTKYVDNPHVLGLGEMMNFPGVLADDPEILAKLSLFSHVDGHAPGLTGLSLCRYIAHGIKTDHECTSAEEAREKLRCGMYILLREGEAARDVTVLSPIVDVNTVSRCCFCTDDRHVDTLVREGSIDHCIRVAIKAGMPENLALRMATLSAAECFGLTDRGVIAPGRVADFCILADTDTFTIEQVYKNGVPAEEIPASGGQTPYQVPAFSCRFPTKTDLVLPETGIARVIGVIAGEIVTQNIPAKPDADGVQKIISVDRYRAGGFTVGLVKGFEMQTGAVASSIAHDAHNIIATGRTDEEILTAVRAVADAGGGLAVVTGNDVTLLSLPIGGLMAHEPADVLLKQLDTLSVHLKRTGAYKQTFGHLSFLSLTVIPHLKITPRGLFDVDTFETVPLFH
ncbi:adenine deaminase [Methanocorpusculum sp. MG]|uniref:Adenine deaminase n=1 Tax=Methanocorpusculum petauri TaxID=3002863 RepID=A0ABT4IHL4_9EURY|nr:adenine deaminase [Methanocorpusculum petauri]MCZ0861046.1 adenine deaminase [Methanocorpusculum petauri]MDE2442979.1 adenine deaminase [Methanocorpusculum sp.]